MDAKNSRKSLLEMMDMQAIGNRAVQKAQEENRRLGIPNVYGHGKQIYYELPDGTITSQSPFEKDSKDVGEKEAD